MKDLTIIERYRKEVKGVKFVWQAFVMILTGMLLLRLAGRKSIAQMTIATTVVMISIGSIIVQPIVDKNIANTILVVAIFISVLISIEYLQLKYNFLENLLSGKSVVVIEDGQPVVKNLKKLRLTADKLEVYLRQQGIAKISDIKTATLEPNGQLGYEFMPHAKPLTVGEFKDYMADLISRVPSIDTREANLFEEVKKEEHDTAHPDVLQ